MKGGPGEIKMRSDLARLTRQAIDAGWTYEPRRNGFFLRSPDGVTTLGVHAHGRSTELAVRRLRQQLRQHGVIAA